MYKYILSFFLLLPGTMGLAQQKDQFSAKYLLYSLAVPGLGEYNLGESSQFKYFFLTEVILWTGALSTNYYSDVLMDNAINFARQKAGITGKITSRDYILAIGDHQNLGAYNDAKLQERLIEDLYPNTADYQWNWSSNDDRISFKRKRQQSDVVSYAVPFFIGAAVVNHLVSTFNVLRLQRTMKKSTAGSGEAVSNLAAIPVDILGRPGAGITLHYSLSF